MGLPRVGSHQENVPGYEHVMQRVTNDAGTVQSYTVHQQFKNGKWIPNAQNTELFEVLDESAAYRPSLDRKSRWQIGKTSEGYPVATLVTREIEEYTPLKNGNTNRRRICFDFWNGNNEVEMGEEIYRKGCKINRQAKVLKKGEELLKLDYKSLIKHLWANTSSYRSENLKTGETSEVTRYSDSVTRELSKNGESIKYNIKKGGTKSIVSAIFPNFVFRGNFLQVEPGFNISKLSPRAKEAIKVVQKLVFRI